MAWLRGLLALLVLPPLLMLLHALWVDPGTPLVLRMLHARALELAGVEGAGAGLARELRNSARDVRNAELAAAAAAGSAGAAAAPAAGTGRDATGLRARQ